MYTSPRGTNFDLGHSDLPIWSEAQMNIISRLFINLWKSYTKSPVSCYSPFKGKICPAYFWREDFLYFPEIFIYLYNFNLAYRRRLLPSIYNRYAIYGSAYKMDAVGLCCLIGYCSTFPNLHSLYNNRLFCQ